jgi:large repetitive protein
MRVSTATMGIRGRAARALCCGVAIACGASGAAPAAGAAPTVPGPPTIISARAGMQNATIAFKKPANDGGATISAFRITCTSSNGGATVTQSGAKSPITVNGLGVGKKYTCRVAARNKVGVGIGSKPSAVIVPLPPPGKGLPDPPTQVHARAEITAVRVSFRGVYISGGAHVTGYLAMCTSSDGGRRNRQQNSITPITVNHLSPGKTYTCVVASRNPAGFGAFSVPSNAVVTLGDHTVPGAPTVTSATAGARRITVAFKKPANDGGKTITSYRVTCVSGNGGNTWSQNGSKSPITVKNLSPRKSYTCRVSARNALGPGSLSAPSKAVVTRSS